MLLTMEICHNDFVFYLSERYLTLCVCVCLKKIEKSLNQQLHINLPGDTVHGTSSDKSDLISRLTCLNKHSTSICKSERQELRRIEEQKNNRRLFLLK